MLEVSLTFFIVNCKLGVVYSTSLKALITEKTFDLNYLLYVIIRSLL